MISTGYLLGFVVMGYCNSCVGGDCVIGDWAMGSGVISFCDCYGLLFYLQILLFSLEIS